MAITPSGRLIAQALRRHMPMAAQQGALGGFQRPGARHPLVSLFVDKARSIGLDPAGLTVQSSSPGLHERMNELGDCAIYQIQWHSRLAHRLPALKPLLDRINRDKFIRIEPGHTILPSGAELACDLLLGQAEVEDAALFLDTQLTDGANQAILAVSVNGAWLALQHWRTSWHGLGIRKLDVAAFAEHKAPERDEDQPSSGHCQRRR